MSKRKRMCCLLPFVLCVLAAGTFTITAFAYSESMEQNPFVVETVIPEDMSFAGETVEPSQEQPDVISGEPFEDKSSVYTRDLLYDKDSHKQFITVQTKSGSTFYIVIDYDKPVDRDGEQYQTYFLNLVDERDLMDLTGEEDLPDMSCNCVDRCAAGAVNTSCSVCKNNTAGCMGKEVGPSEPVKDEEPELLPDAPQKENPGGAPTGVLAVIGLLAVVGGGAYYYIRFVRGRKQKDEDLDVCDDDGYEDGPYVNEDGEPDVADDSKYGETEGENQWS